MKKQMNILMLCPDLPFPIRAGGQMRMASFGLALARCCRLHIACLAPDLPAATRAWANDLGVTIENFPATAKDTPVWYRRARAIVTRNNLRYHPKEQDFFNAVLDRQAPDMVWLETPYLIRYVLKWLNNVPVVVNHWGTSEGARRRFEYSSGFNKIKEWIIWWVAVGTERRYTKLLNHLVCVSKLDAQYFQSIAPRCRVWPIPNGILGNRVVSLEEDEIDREDPYTMIMTGDLSYRPNIDAALYFTGRIFPLVKRELPSAVFRLVGRDPSPEILTLRRIEGIEVMGFVPDLAKEINRSTIYVLPMRLGSGIRSKLFDVFPLGKAIVTTSIGAEGLALRHGDNCLIADLVDDFARNCIRLLKDQTLRVKLGKEVKRLALEVYHQDKINVAVKEVIHTVMGA